MLTAIQQTFETQAAALDFIKSLGLIETGYGQYGDANRSVRLDHDALDFFDITWRVTEIDCPEDRAWFAKNGKKAWVRRQFAALRKKGR